MPTTTSASHTVNEDVEKSIEFYRLTKTDTWLSAFYLLALAAVKCLIRIAYH